MLNISIRTRNADIQAELDDSDISNAIWFALPFRNTINMLGDEIYFEFPLNDVEMKGEQVTVLDVGDIAYWPKVGALCLFFGPTPLSGEDGRPVSRYPVIKIGKMKGDCSVLEEAGDRQRIFIERS
ncbi:MAG: AfsR family transcriptional regulator [Candidatus Methanomethylophilaceae archaeon]|nr:AfsR family transcriptional regulator [Candidatus Methanomethylophilaceae archaeon]